MYKATAPVFVFLILSAAVNAQEVKEYTLPGLISYFALDNDEVATIQAWDIAGRSDAPVKWTAGEPQWDVASSTYIKTGTTDVMLDGTKIPVTVSLIGTKIVVNRVLISFPKSPTLQVFDFEKLVNAEGFITGFIKCDNPMPKSYGTLAYSAFVSKKKEFWIAYTWQCLKGECSAGINIFYEKDKAEKLPCY